MGEFFNFSFVCGILLYQAPTSPLNILSVIFYLPQTLTWISRKIDFPTRDIKTRTRDIQHATISQTQNIKAASEFSPQGWRSFP